MDQQICTYLIFIHMHAHTLGEEKVSDLVRGTWLGIL